VGTRAQIAASAVRGEFDTFEPDSGHHVGERLIEKRAPLDTKLRRQSVPPSFTDVPTACARTRAVRHDQAMREWVQHIGNDRNRLRIIRMLEQFEEAGASVVMPETKTRGDYLNVLPPGSSARTGRTCSVHVRTGRVEFQGGSWDRLVDARGFDRLNAGSKAARTPNSDTDVGALVEAFRRELEATR
jgi:hypothetical protein